MQYSKNLKLNLPERNDQFNLDHWNENTNNLDELVYQNQLGVSQNKNDISTIFEGLSNKNVDDINSVYYKLMKLIYPVGCLYWSSNNTNPSLLFGGTWSQIKDKFILSAGDEYKNNDIGGNARIILDIDNLPSHNHTFTPSGKIGSHNHEMEHYHSRGTMEITGEFISRGIKGDSNLIVKSTGAFKHEGYSNLNDYDRVNTESTNAIPERVSFTASRSWVGRTSGAYSSQSENDFTSRTTTSSSTINFSGNQGTTSSVGSAEEINNLPPYIVKYCWERTN